MIFRIDIQHFLSHMIDHFSYDDITNMQYAIISSKVANNSKCMNVVKCSELYPTPEIIIAYDELGDKKSLERMYFDMLDMAEDQAYMKRKSYINPMDVKLYRIFLNPLLKHINITIVCDENENDYIDCLCNYLKKRFDIDVIDLNQLFKKGKIGPIYIDRDELRDEAVKLRRAAVKEEYRSLASTDDGKRKLIENMTKKMKLKKLKELGVKITNDEKKYLDSILFEEWKASEEDS